MKTKLTLSVDKSVASDAHAQAAQSGKSISKLFSEFVVAQKRAAERRKIPGIRQLAGSLRGYAIDDSKTGIRKAYAKKHLR